MGFLLYYFSVSVSDFEKIRLQIQSLESRWNDSLKIKPMHGGSPTQFSFLSKEKCALLIHGFNSSPQEMYWVAKIFESIGWSCISLCLPGFVNGPIGANLRLETQWKNALAETFSIVNSCFNSTILVGHSLGATLSLYQSKAVSPKPTRLILLSPYLGPFKKVDSISLTLLGYFFDSLSYKTLFRLSRNPDMKPLLANPGLHGTRFPLIGVRSVIALGKNFDVTKSIPNADALVIDSELDQTISKKRINMLLNQHPSWRRIRFSKQDLFNHQLRSSRVESSKRLADAILQFASEG
jgi:pimeloyl-ACP methyl ester carboxylesterase